jgi:hypothetical protein
MTGCVLIIYFWPNFFVFAGKENQICLATKEVRTGMEGLLVRGREILCVPS